MSFDEMNKAQLRAACKAAGIAYGKMNNDRMRVALKALEEEAAAEANDEVDTDEVDSDEEQNEEVKPQPAPAAQPAEPVAPRAKVIGEVVQSKSLKIEKGRPSQNGVTRPSEGSICREIWNALDAKRASVEGGEVEFEHVRELMKAHNWQRNTAFTQFQRWKQFHGIMPRDQQDDAE